MIVEEIPIEYVVQVRMLQFSWNDRWRDNDRIKAFSKFSEYTNEYPNNVYRIVEVQKKIIALTLSDD